MILLLKVRANNLLTVVKTILISIQEVIFILLFLKQIKRILESF